MFSVKGTFLDTPTPASFRIRKGFMVVENGLCAGFFDELPEACREAEIYDYADYLITPGLYDLHLHAPQYSFCGTAMDLELIDWLSNYTYPEEAKYVNAEYAEQSYGYFVRDLKESATARACIFATLHTDATLILMRQLEESGLITFVGKLNMDRNSPDHYREMSAEAGVAETRRWIEKCRNFTRTLPIITPRFTPSVTDEYMAALGELSEKYDLPVQSHLSESTSEIEWVRALCPDAETYADTYARYGLFGEERTAVMAHCIHCTAKENELLKKNGVYIAHCPTSNANVIAGICPAAFYLRNDFRIGLGSDVAGGHTLNLFTVMTFAVQSSKLRWKYIDQSERPLTFAESFYMASAGGGRVFGKTGLFEPGYDFDAIVLDDSMLHNNRDFTPLERLERYAYLGDGKPSAKFVCGKKL